MAGDITRTSATLVTSDGIQLDSEIATPGYVQAAAVLTHPHPLYGGSMQSLVTGELFRTLPDRGVAAIRFNFRGVGGSEGSHGGGFDERRDVVAAVDALSELDPGPPLFVAGWSFGADVALAVDDTRLAGWFVVAPPLRVLPPDRMLAANDPRPKLLVVPEHDEFRPPDSARSVIAGWHNAELVVVPGADHFLVGRTDRVVDLAADFARRLSSAGPLLGENTRE